MGAQGNLEMRWEAFPRCLKSMTGSYGLEHEMVG
jgi:hypothetical protein